MWQSLINSLGSINWVITIPLLSLIGGFLAFVIWGWRKNILELEKLRLEVEELRKKDSPIYIPTQKEIEDILKKTLVISRDDIVIGEDVPVIEFGRHLHYLLNYSLARFYGDLEAWKTIKREYKYLYDLTASGRDEFILDRTYYEWEKVQPKIVRKLPAETIRDIDSLLNILIALRKAKDQQTASNNSFNPTPR